MGSRKWLFVTLAVCGLVSACSQYNTNLSIQTSSSTLTSVSPRSGNVGSGGFTITANGSGFTSNAILLWNGAALTTTYVSSVQLTATVPASDLATAGTVQIAVQIPGASSSGTSNVYNTTTTELSNIVLFEVSANTGQPPVIGSISPASAPFCGNPNGFTLTVTGTNFTSDSIVTWNSLQRSTTVVSSTQLAASILPMDTASSTPAVVAVSSSAGTSKGVSFTMTTPQTGLAAPQGVSMLTPASALAGSQAVALTITGNSPGAGQAFLPCSVVQWATSSGKVSFATSYVSPTQLTATIPAADLTAAGSAQILVMTPTPGGGTSSTGQTFAITPPTTPMIASLSSSGSTPYCSTSSFTLTVNGKNFVNGSVINWNGSPLSTSNTTFVGSTQLTAIIPYTDTLTQGSVPFSVPVTVSNGSLVSKPVNFSVTAPTTNFPQPTTTTLTPSSVPAGSTLAVPLLVTGSNFLPCSVIQWNGTPLPTNYLSPTQLSATITAAQIAAVGAGTVSVTVFNPSPGGGTSTPPLTFTVAAPTIMSLSASTTSMASTPSCSTSPLTLTATGTNFVPGDVVNWNGSPRSTTFESSTQLAAAISATDTAFLATGPAAPAINVSNGSLITSSLKFSLTAPTAPGMAPAPAITALTPSSAAIETAPGAALLLTVSGSNFYPCSSVNWSSTAAPSSPLPAVVFIGPTAINTLIPATDLTSVGNHQVTVANGPALTTVNPNTGQQGQTNESVNLTGQFTHWVQGSSTASFGAGITVATLTVNSATTATAALNIDPAAAAGARNVTVTTGAEVVTLNNGFTVTNGMPVLTTVNPNTGQQGQTNESVNLTGQFTHWMQGRSTANFGVGITVATLTVNSATTATAALNIDPAAAAGARNVTVTTGAEVVTLNNGFTVTNGAPVLTTVNPNTGQQGQTNESVNLTGQFTHWVQGSSMASFGAGITVATLRVNSATTATAALNIDPAAAAGARNVTVTTGAEVVTLNNGFTVTIPPFQVFSPIASVSTSPAGIGGQLALPLMSSDQRYGVYVLASTDGTTEKPGTTKQIFLADTCTGVAPSCTPSNTLVTVGVSSNPGNGDSISPSISSDSAAADNADGRYVLFLSSATNLLASGTNGFVQVFVRDTCVRAPSGSNCVPTTQLVSVASDGVTQANGASTSATISANGRYVTFASSANNLAPNAPMLGGIYLRDTCVGVASGCTPSTQLLSTQSQ